MKRKKSREILMKILYETSINKQDYKEVIENLEETSTEDIETLDMVYVNKVLEGIEKNYKEIDNNIEKHLKKWKMSRLSKIDLSILRIAVYEIMYEEDIPQAVSINEAVELAKKYSTENSAPFINGVLGNLVERG